MLPVLQKDFLLLPCRFVLILHIIACARRENNNPFCQVAFCRKYSAAMICGADFFRFGRFARSNRFGRGENMKTLSVTMIVKNEQDNLPDILPSLTFADEIIVADTGSSDNTVAVAKSYGAKVFEFPWANDFAAARNFAIGKASCGYVMWLDADDVLPQRTVEAICKWKLSASNADVYYVRYVMQGGNFSFWRERIIRRCERCRFKGFIHEAIVPFGRCEYLSCEVRHNAKQSHERRNLDIYREAIAARKRFSARDKYYYARTLVECGLPDEALPVLNKCRLDKKLYVADRAEACALAAKILLAQKRISRAKSLVMYALTLLPPSSKLCCEAGDVYLASGSYALAEGWYKTAFSAADYGFCESCYKHFYPNMQLAVCCWYLGKKEEARAYFALAKAAEPSHPSVVTNERWFLS